MELVPIILDLEKELRIEANVSDHAIERVLLIKCKNKKWRLVAFIFKLLNKTERNYKIHNKEMLVIIRYLEI